MVVDYATPRPFLRNKISLSDDLPGSASDSGSPKTDKHVVIVMDGLEDFTIEPLEWALKNIAAAGCIVTLLGFMPCFNIPLSSKTWRDVRMVKFEDLNTAKEKNIDWNSDAK